MCWSLLLLLSGVIVFGVSGVDMLNSRVVHIAQGAIRGYRLPEGNNIFGFYNIPYATAPSGKDRFQASLPPPTWKNVFEAVDKGIVCPQGHSPDVDLKNKTMQEDCLIANMFVPDTNENNIPVLVYVHGGGFQVGYGNENKWITLVKQSNIIVVNFNYRLGILGNLCLGTEGVPGNIVMKDQVALLQWVKRNIASFGGDPETVTVAGCSTGSVSVDLLSLSQTTKGLFNKLIINSGSSLDVFALQQNPLQIARTQAKKLKLTDSDDIVDLEKNYKAAPTKLLTMDVFDDMKDSTVVFAPCVERNESSTSFLNEAPYNIFKEQQYPKIPTMYSFDNMEGLLKIAKYETWINRMNEKFSDFLPANIQIDNEQEKEATAQVIKDFYFKEGNNSSAVNYVNYFTDAMFIYGILKSIQFRVKGGNDKIYLMEYSFTDENTPMVSNTSVRGANHCSQVIAVTDENESLLTMEYRAVKATIRNLWANFIKTGEPTQKGTKPPHWSTVSNTLEPVLSLKSSVPVIASLRELGLQNRFHFWDDIYKKYYRVPIPPSP